MNNEVIVVNYTGRRGAGNLAAYEMSKALVENGYKVIPIVSADMENLEIWEKVNFEKIIVIKTYTNNVSFVVNSLLFRIKTAPKIKKALKGYKIKAVYCPMLTLWSDRINSLIKYSKIIMAVHDPTPHSGTPFFLKIFNRRQILYDAVIVHSKVFVEQVKKKKNNNVYYIPLGRLNIYRDVEQKKAIISYDSKKLNYLFFGRIEDYKGLDILADAWKVLCEKHKDDITLSIVGNGDFSLYEEKYKHFDNVTIINRWIKDCEVESVFEGENIVCVCPYKDGTQSGVILTAFDYCVPVIASDTGGISEQIINNKTGILIKPNNLDELVHAMEEFIYDGNKHSMMQREIDDYIKEISWDKSAKLLLDVIKDIC